MTNIKNLSKDHIWHVIDYMPGPTTTISSRNYNITVNDTRLPYIELKHYDDGIGQREYKFKSYW